MQPDYSQTITDTKKYAGKPVTEIHKMLTEAGVDPNDIYIVKSGSMVTMDYRLDRIRIWTSDGVTGSIAIG